MVQKSASVEDTSSARCDCLEDEYIKPPLHVGFRLRCYVTNKQLKKKSVSYVVLILYLVVHACSRLSVL